MVSLDLGLCIYLFLFIKNEHIRMKIDFFLYKQIKVSRKRSTEICLLPLTIRNLLLIRLDFTATYGRLFSNIYLYLFSFVP